MSKFARFDKFQIATVAAVLVAAGGYGLWSYMSGQQFAAAKALPVALAEAGWRVTLDAQSVQGFPARSDITVENIAVEPAAVAPAWPFRLVIDKLQSRSLIYRPDYLALDAPAGLALETPTGDLSIAGGVEASIGFGDGQGDGDRSLERLSISGADLALATTREDGERQGSVDLAELHLRPAPDGDLQARRVFMRLDGLTIANVTSATLRSLRLDGLARFSTPPTNGAGLAFDVESLTIGDAAAPGLVLDFGNGVLRLSGKIERHNDGWRGLLGFETDEGQAVLAHLKALDILSSEEADAIEARLAASGRIAGVLSVAKGRLSVEDIQPEPIEIALPKAPSMEHFWRLQ